MFPSVLCLIVPFLKRTTGTVIVIIKSKLISTYCFVNVLYRNAEIRCNNDSLNRQLAMFCASFHLLKYKQMIKFFLS